MKLAGQLASIHKHAPPLCCLWASVLLGRTTSPFLLLQRGQSFVIIGVHRLLLLRYWWYGGFSGRRWEVLVDSQVAGRSSLLNVCMANSWTVTSVVIFVGEVCHFLRDTGPSTHNIV